MHDPDVRRFVEVSPPPGWDGDLPILTLLLGRVTDEMVAEASAYREQPGDVQDIRTTLEATQLPPNWRDAISKVAYDFIVRWETGGKAYYEQIIKGRPVWPGYASGITIGCGYDLGYHTPTDFQAQWGTRIAKADFERLARTIGFKTVEPNRAQKVTQAKALVVSLADIVVPWTVAIEQFDHAKMPDLIGQLYRALDHLDRLHPHCRGALLSLVFNRGPAFTQPGPRFAEMRAIRQAMSTGTKAAFAGIPNLLRSMKRIWGAQSSLAERREGEAKLFEAGLAEMGMLEQLVAGAAAIAENALEAAATERPTEQHEALEVAVTDEVDEEEQAVFAAPLDSLEAAPAAVRWNPKDDEQPDYRHLDNRLAGSTFELRPEDLDTLITANQFALRPGNIVFALRGAGLVGGVKREDATSITVTDQRPDHRDFRCIIGVYHVDARRLSAYQASTVPNATYVRKCFADFKAGTPIGKLTGNILPTGCYTLTVGTHKKGKKGEIPTVLRLSTTTTGASSVLVLRSLNDVMYDRFDRFVIATPADNVHPGQLATGFSSAGCLTMPGRFDGSSHTGLWRDFRAALGIDGGSDGKQFSLVLLTGLDAGLAADARMTGNGAEPLARLRHGSKGAAVARLQAALGLAPDPSQLLGPVTRDALVKRQIAKLGWADGIYSAEMDALLGLTVMA